MRDLFKKQIVRNLDTYMQGLTGSKEADRDFLAQHNMELLMRGISPNERERGTNRRLTMAERVFNPYLCHHYARLGDPTARAFWQEYAYYRHSQNTKVKLSADIAVSYNRLIDTLKKRQTKYGR